MSFPLLPLVAGAAAVAFQCVNWSLDTVGGGPCGKYAARERHKWRNASTSLVNSVLMSALVFCGFYWHPAFRSDLLHYSMMLGDITMAVLAGYYMYDLYDLVSHNKFATIWPLIGHHTMGVGIVSLAQHYRVGTGLIFVSLLCEVNAIFLHLRQVLLMHGVTRSSPLFRTVKALNLTTFVAFRLAPMLYAGYYACTAQLPPVLAVVTPPVTVFIIPLNFVLLRRVVYNDYMRKDNNNKPEEETSIMDR